jgi:hypothetical protein
VAQLLQIEGLAGPLTGGLAGGLADLRSSHGAALADTPFDENFHTADFRAGQGALGHFGIPKLLVFLWRLTSFTVMAGTPVAVANCTNQYVFDPTGREIPLFLPPPPPVSGDFSESWTSAQEWQVPGPLTGSLTHVPPGYGLGGGAQLASVWPEIGRFATDGPPPEPLTVDYQYGFSSMLGAGPYNRDLLGDPPPEVGSTPAVVTGGTGLDTALTAIGTTGTITINDSRTYTALAGAGSTGAPIASLLVRAGPGMRPVLRPAAAAGPWVFTGGDGARLVLDGLTVTGCDIVLRGSFDTVRITACTIDPGTAAEGTLPLATAADGATLAPCRIFIEADPGGPAGAPGTIRQLQVDRSILGPVRTRFGGSVETLTITDSIVQGLPATAGTAYTAADIFDASLLARGLTAGDNLAQKLHSAMPAAATAALQAYVTASLATQQAGLPPAVLSALDALVSGPSLYDPALFAPVNLSAGVRALAAEAATLDPAHLAALNRGLLDESFPVALGVAALAVADATLQLNRVTVLGRIAAHRLFASDSILRDFAAVDDTQDGCVRFSAYTLGSAIPRQYESAVITPGAPVFTSDSYGQPGYAQLLETADAAIVGGSAAASLLSGTENHSEMGAFSADLNPVKEQALLTKYAEYMPLGLTPVLVHVT